MENLVRSLFVVAKSQTGPNTSAVALGDLEADVALPRAAPAELDVLAVAHNATLLHVLAQIPARPGDGRAPPKPLTRRVHRQPKEQERRKFWRWPSAFLLAVPTTALAFGIQRRGERAASGRVEAAYQASCRTAWCSNFAQTPFVGYPVVRNAAGEAVGWALNQPRAFSLNYTASCLAKFGSDSIDVPNDGTQDTLFIPQQSGPYGKKVAQKALLTKDVEDACPDLRYQRELTKDCYVLGYCAAALVAGLVVRALADRWVVQWRQGHLHRPRKYPLAEVTYPELYALQRKPTQILSLPAQREAWRKRLFTELSVILGEASARADVHLMEQLAQVGLPLAPSNPAGESPLAVAIRYRAEPSIDYLLGNGAPAGAQELLAAARAADVRTFRRLLLGPGAPAQVHLLPNDFLGYFCAAQRPEAQDFTCLLGDLQAWVPDLLAAKNSFGKTPLDLAQYWGRLPQLEVLQLFGQVPSTTRANLEDDAILPAPEDAKSLDVGMQMGGKLWQAALEAPPSPFTAEAHGRVPGYTAPMLASWLAKASSPGWPYLPGSQDLEATAASTFGLLRAFAPSLHAPWTGAAQSYLVASSPAQLAQFAALRASFGSSFMVHGTLFSSWHQVLHQGLEPKSGTSMERNGSAYGRGIYLSTISNLSASHAFVGPVTQDRLLGVVEVIDHPEVVTAGDSKVVPHKCLVQLRGVLSYTAGAHIPYFRAADLAPEFQQLQAG